MMKIIVSCCTKAAFKSKYMQVINSKCISCTIMYFVQMFKYTYTSCFHRYDDNNNNNNNSTFKIKDLQSGLTDTGRWRRFTRIKQQTAKADIA